MQREKLCFFEEKLAFYRDLEEKDKSSNDMFEEAESTDEQQSAFLNEHNLKSLGSNYRVLKIEICLVKKKKEAKKLFSVFVSS